MSQVRLSVEWIFEGIINLMKFLDSKKNLKVQLSAVGNMCTVFTLLQNASCCLYGSTTTEYCGITPPEIQDYVL